MGTLLQVEDLSVVYTSRERARVLALDRITFDVAEGEAVGILGESGAGKTTLALSLLLLQPPNVWVSGSIRYRGRELFGLREAELQKVRGAEISVIFQEPSLALHPALCVGEQVADVIRAHSRQTRRRCREEAKTVLEQVQLDDLDRIYAAYPHQLSGGQRQRVAIALALASRPSLLVADEATAALDSTLQAEMLALLRDLNQRLGLAMLLISHDVAFLASLAQRLLVMYCGSIVERGSVRQVLESPHHAYTRMLVQSLRRYADLGETPETPQRALAMPLAAGSRRGA